MEIINKSRKIIGINGEPLLPGEKMTLHNGLESHPSIKEYLAKVFLVDANKEKNASADAVCDAEKEKIAAEAIEKYKAEQEAMKVKQDEINAVKGMKKDELLKKAVAMGVEVKDDEKVEVIREQILEAIQ